MFVIKSPLLLFYHHSMGFLAKPESGEVADCLGVFHVSGFNRGIWLCRAVWDAR
jgi:hypothetical protein